MRKFTDIAAERGLKLWLDKPKGTLYYRPTAYEDRVIPLIVRHFDGEWTPDLVFPFGKLVREAQAWIERQPDLARLVRVEQPFEVGEDFVARKHYIYYTSTDAYDEWNENAPEPPPEFEEMRRIFDSARTQTSNKCERMIATVLSHSILRTERENILQRKRE